LHFLKLYEVRSDRLGAGRENERKEIRQCIEDMDMGTADMDMEAMGVDTADIGMEAGDGEAGAGPGAGVGYTDGAGHLAAACRIPRSNRRNRVLLRL
jgi:hypothetical protein